MAGRNSFKWIVAMVPLVIGGGLPFGSMAGPEVAPNTLCVMTFNLRFASANPPNAWYERRPVVRDCIEQVAPDLIGTQEGVYQQIKDLDQDLPHYDWIGLGRDGGSRGEFMAIYYRKDRFEPLEFDHFWLSDTPEVIGSATWGNTNRRMVTWTKLRDRFSGQSFYFWNTHFDHAVPEARKKSAELVRSRLEALDPEEPVLLVGDFNAEAGGSPVYEILVENGPLADTWPEAEKRLSPVYATYHGYEEPTEGGPRIDWILRMGDAQTRASKIVTFKKGDQYPSDHFPVVSWIDLP